MRGSCESHLLSCPPPLNGCFQGTVRPKALSSLSHPGVKSKDLELDTPPYL